MAGPVFNAIGARSQSAGAASIAPSLPTLVTNGNGLLVCVVTSKNNATHSTATGGWTKLGQVNSGASFTASVFTARQGSGAPTVTWTGSVACSAQIAYYAAPDGALDSTLGNSTSNSGATATHSTTAITTGRANSLAIYVDVAAANTAIGTPSGGWAEDVDAGSATDAGRTAFGSKSIAASGASSGAISVTGANAAWVQWQIELRLTAPPSPSFQVSKEEVLAWYDPPDGFDVSKEEILAWYDPSDGFAVSKMEVLAWYDPATSINVGDLDPDDTETLTTGNTYYRRILIPADIDINTIMFEVSATSATCQVTGKLYADNAGAVGAQLATSNAQTGTTANLADDLPLTTVYSANAGQYIWAAISIAAANVVGKVKKGGGGVKSGQAVPDAYAVWVQGYARTEAVPLLTILDNVTHAEASSGTTSFVFDVTRQMLTTGSTTVDWAVSGTGSNPASASDFSGGVFPSGTLTFNASDTLKQISISVIGDGTIENDETFLVTLSNASGGATIGIATATGTITNDDVAVTVANAAQGHTATSPSLAAKSSVSIGSAAQAQAATTSTVDFIPGEVTAQSASHTQTATSPAITAKSSAAPANAAQAQAASSPSIGAKSAADPDDAVHAHNGDNVEAHPNWDISTDDASHTHACTAPTLAAKSSITVGNALHVQTSTAPALLAKSSVTIGSAAHDQAASESTIAAHFPAIAQSATQDQTSTEPSIAWKGSIYPDSAAQAHTATGAVVAMRIRPADTSPARRGIVTTNERLGIVPGLPRLGIVPMIDRSGATSGADRSGIVAGFSRLGSVPGFDRSADAPAIDRSGEP